MLEEIKFESDEFLAYANDKGRYHGLAYKKFNTYFYQGDLDLK